MFIDLRFSDILMRAERKSISHLVSLVNIASGRFTIKLFICYQVNSRVLHFTLPMVLCIRWCHFMRISRIILFR